MGWIKDEFNTLRPLYLLLAAVAVGFLISAVYRMGYESGMQAGFDNEHIILQDLIDAEVKAKQSGDLD